MSRYNSSDSRIRLQPMILGRENRSEYSEEGTFLSKSSTPRSTTSPQPSPLPTHHRWSSIDNEDNYVRSVPQQESKDENLAWVSVREARSYSEISLEGAKGPIRRRSNRIIIKQGLQGNWQKLATHIFAVSVTTAVIQLSFRNIYWMDLRSPNEFIAPALTQGGALSFLQLAAKLHELLILASISAIVIHAVQHHLNGRSGLPLGLISNAFELNSGQYLRQKAFWTTLWSVDPNTGRRFLFARFWLLLLFSMLLVTLSGPTSAIAVIPTLNYFELRRPFTDPVLPYYVFNESTELWPETLTAASLNGPDSGISCLNADSTIEQDQCPAGGFRDMYNWAGGLLFANSDRGTNITFPDSSGTRRIATVQSCNSTFDGRASGVTINQFLSGALTTYWAFAQQNFEGIALDSAQPRITLDPNTEIFAPRVETMCNTYTNFDFDPNNPDAQTNMTFPTMDGTVIPVPDWTYKYSRPLNASNVTFIELPQGPNYPSLGAVLVLPLIEQVNGTWVQSTENIACSIYSQWIPVSVFYEPTINPQVTFDVASPLHSTCLASIPTINTSRQPINTTITQAYADAINQPIEFINGPEPAILGMLSRLIFTDSAFIPNGTIFRSPIPAVAKGSANVNVTDEVARRQRAKVVSTLLAGVVTDGMARNAGAGTYPYAASMFLLPGSEAVNGSLQGRFTVTSASGGEDLPLNATTAENWLNLSPRFQRYGYGYRWEGSRTTQFGISVLIVHVLCALAHVCWILSGAFIGREVNESGEKVCESVPEMLGLALASEKMVIGEGGDKVWESRVVVRQRAMGEWEMVVPENEGALSGMRNRPNMF